MKLALVCETYHSGKIPFFSSELCMENSYLLNSEFFHAHLSTEGIHTEHGHQQERLCHKEM